MKCCMTTDSRKSDCKFSTLGGQNVLVVDPSFAENYESHNQKNSSIDDLRSTESVETFGTIIFICLFLTEKSEYRVNQVDHEHIHFLRAQDQNIEDIRPSISLPKSFLFAY